MPACLSLRLSYSIEVVQNSFIRDWVRVSLGGVSRRLVSHVCYSVRVACRVRNVVRKSSRWCVGLGIRRSRKRDFVGVIFRGDREELLWVWSREF